MERSILPTNVIPSHYDLELKVDISNSKFYGLVNIVIEIKNQTNNIVLNSKSLNISSSYATINNEKYF